MRLLTFYPTIGEEILFESLDALTKHTPASTEIDLRLWYDCCGRGVNQKFLDRCLTYTKDVIVSFENQRLNPILGYFTIYPRADWIFYLTPDAILLPGYWDKVTKVLNAQGLDKVGMIGDAWHEHEGEVVVNDYAHCPDGTMLISRKALDAAGGFNATFHGRGPGHIELARRFHAQGFSFCSIKGMSVHGGQQHQGRDLDPAWRKDLHADNLAYLRMDFRRYRGYNWWSHGN